MNYPILAERFPARRLASLELACNACGATWVEDDPDVAIERAEVGTCPECRSPDLAFRYEEASRCGGCGRVGHWPEDLDFCCSARCQLVKAYAATLDGAPRSSADFSDDGVYRFRLDRLWWPGRKRALFVCLNPSTADATADDPTIRRCIGFAKREGCGALTVVNLFAMRATNPSELTIPDPPGVTLRNDATIVASAADADPIVVAWGARSGVDERVAQVAAMLPSAVCLGTTRDSSPRHPLYVRGDQPLEPWRPR